MVDHRSHIQRVASSFVAVLLLATACAGSELGTETRSPAEPAVNASPSPLDGLFFNGHSVLKVEKGKWSLQAQTLRMDGVIEVDEGRLVISKEISCEDEGTYAWTLGVETLSLQVEADPCPGREIILSGRWNPITEVDDNARVGQIVVLPDLHFAFFHGQRDVSVEESAEIDVVIRQGKAWFFSPTVLMGSPSQQLELTIRNPTGPGIATFGHNFTLPEEGIDVDIPAGEQATVTLRFPASGSLTFLCKYHGDHGQAGLLTVAD